MQTTKTKKKNKLLFAKNTILEFYHQKKIDQQEFAAARRYEGDYFFAISRSFASQNLSLSRSGGKQETREPLQEQIDASRRVAEIKSNATPCEVAMLEFLIEKERDVRFVAKIFKSQESEVLRVFRKALAVVEGFYS